MVHVAVAVEQIPFKCSTRTLYTQSQIIKTVYSIAGNFRVVKIFMVEQSPFG